MAVAERDFLPLLQESSCPPPRPARKRLVRRAGRDWSQPLRRLIQGLFLALNIILGLQLVLFVRYFESGGRTLHVSRPAGVEGYLPIAGLMNLKYFIITKKLPTIHPAAMFLLVAFLLMSFIFRKAFCSWLCPVGTLSEALWKMGRKLLKENWTLPRWLDIPLRGLKYLIFGLFLYAVTAMSAASIEAFLSSPYGLVADVKMLNFFRYLSETAAIPRRSGRSLDLLSELLVPLSLPLRRADGAGLTVQSFADTPRSQLVHRLRKVHQGLPVASGRG